MALYEREVSEDELKFEEFTGENLMDGGFNFSSENVYLMDIHRDRGFFGSDIGNKNHHRWTRLYYQVNDKHNGRFFFLINHAKNKAIKVSGVLEDYLKNKNHLQKLFNEAGYNIDINEAGYSDSKQDFQKSSFLPMAKQKGHECLFDSTYRFKKQRGFIEEHAPLTFDAAVTAAFNDFSQGWALNFEKLCVLANRVNHVSRELSERQLDQDYVEANNEQLRKLQNYNSGSELNL